LTKIAGSGSGSIVRGMDPRIRIHIKMSWIPNTAVQTYQHVYCFLIRIFKKSDPQKTEKSDRDPHGSDAGPQHCSTLSIYLCGVAHLVARLAAVRRPRVRISARHPNGGPLPERTTMRKLERNSTNVMNECVVYECI
jgi:hypothetical protein